MGSPDFNGAAAQSSGSVVFRVVPAPANGTIAVNLTDVRCQGLSGGCSNGALSDYTGSLLFASKFRVTDKNNGPTGPSRNGTVTDLDVNFPVPCQTTASGSVGATCSATTSIDAVLGGSTAVESGMRAIWEPIASRTGAGSRSPTAGPTGSGRPSATRCTW